MTLIEDEDKACVNKLTYNTLVVSTLQPVRHKRSHIELQYYCLFTGFYMKTHIRQRIDTFTKEITQ